MSSSGFWSESFWLPAGRSWKDFKEDASDDWKWREGSVKSGAKFNDLYYYPYAMALAILVLRFTLERLVFRRLGLSLGISPPPRGEANAHLERHFRLSGRRAFVSEQDAQSLAEASGKSPRNVKMWMHHRKELDKQSTLEKFQETSWRLLYYTGIFAYGLVTLWDKPWFWDTEHCWRGYPHHSIEPDLWRYIMVELGFYWSLCISQFFDTRRKDFWQMFLHHVTTIFLITLAWVCNFTRMATLVLFLHDFVDIILEFAKVTSYLNYRQLSNYLFALFGFSWILTRDLVFPAWILRSTVFEAPRLVAMFPGYYVLNGLLFLLFGLHIAWTYYIVKAVARARQAGLEEGCRDNRSDTEDDDDDDDVDEDLASNAPFEPSQPSLVQRNVRNVAAATS